MALCYVIIKQNNLYNESRTVYLSIKIINLTISNTHMEIFLATRGPHYIYEFIVSSSLKNCQNLIKKELQFLLFKERRIISLRFFIFFFYIILSGKIFKNNRALIKFNDIEIGRFVLSSTYCDFECYKDKLRFYKVLIKNFLKAGFLLDTCEYYHKRFKIKGAYIDHCGYLNGIIFSFFAKKGVVIYTNNYPLGIYCVDYSKNKNKDLLKYENSLRITVKKNIKQINKKKTYQKISLLVKNKKFIPYLIKASYKKLANIDYNKFDYVIYAHSFTDGQLWHGYAGFENNLKWLEFTLDELKNTNKKILIKPHPNYYNKSLATNAVWDKKIYNDVLKKYKKCKNLYFIQEPIHNYMLLQKLNKNCILISKHGTAIIEAAYMNFKSISCSSNFFDKKFKITNMWDKPSDYSKLLNEEIHLKRPNKIDLLKLIHSLFYFYNSEYHPNFYENIIRKNLNLSKKKYQKIIQTVNRGKISNSKIIILNKYIGLKKEKTIEDISKTIHRVYN